MNVQFESPAVVCPMNVLLWEITGLKVPEANDNSIRNKRFRIDYVCS
jgi:hypothetical protein